MDQTLVEMLAERNIGPEEIDGLAYRHVNEETGEVEFILSANDSLSYTFKPLQELFLTGTQAEPSSIDWTYERNMLLLQTIELAILSYDEDQKWELRDGQVALTLDRLIANCAADTSADPLTRRIQFDLRLLLSYSDYSKYEVKMALRKIAKSLNLHTGLHGIRGYLDFISKALSGA